MVFKISDIFGTKQKKGKGPLLNEFLMNPRSDPRTTFGLSTSLEKKRKFWQWFRDQTELSSPVTIRVNDTIQQVEFFASDGTALGRNKLLEAKRFWAGNFMDDRLKSIWFDAMVTGDGFGWKGFITNDQLKEVTDIYAQKHASKSGIDIKQLKDRFYLKAIDEDLRTPRVFDYVAASTMLIQNNEKEVQGYRQIVSTHEVQYNTEEIIHFMFQSIDGKVNGTTPVSGLAREMILLWFIKENMISYIRNGGTPNKIFTLPEGMPNDDNYKFMVQTLMEYNAVENRNGNLVLTGKVDVQDLNANLRDMEYKDLASWVTSNIAYGLQIPVSRIPRIGVDSGGDSGGLADSGYWSMIESDQRKIENLLNTQLFKERGFIVKFKKRYKLDDLRETQALTMKADGITKLQTIFNSYGKRLTPGKILSMMDLPHNAIEEIPKKDLVNPLMENNLMGQNQLNNVQMEGDKMAKRDDKRTEQANSPVSANNTPGGQ